MVENILLFVILLIIIKEKMVANMLNKSFSIYRYDSTKIASTTADMIMFCDIFMMRRV